MLLVFLSLCGFGVYGFKNTQVVLKRGQLCVCWACEGFVVDDEAGKISEEYNVSDDIGQIGEPASWAAVADDVQISTQFFQFCPTVQKIFSQGL